MTAVCANCGGVSPCWWCPTDPVRVAILLAILRAWRRSLRARS